jgi:hypothetical protein
VTKTALPLYDTSLGRRPSGVLCLHIPCLFQCLCPIFFLAHAWRGVEETKKGCGTEEEFELVGVGWGMPARTRHLRRRRGQKNCEVCGF